MEAAEKRKKLCLGYGIAILVLVTVCTAAVIVSSQEAVMAFINTRPILLVDVIVIAALLASALIRICVEQEYKVNSIFRMQRRKLYQERRRVMKLCCMMSTAIALAWKLFVVFGSNRINGEGIGRITLYCAITGMCYACLMYLLVLLLDLIPAGIVSIVYAILPVLLLMLSSARIPVWTIVPEKMLQAAVAGMIAGVAAVKAANVHKRHYERLDC